MVVKDHLLKSIRSAAVYNKDIHVAPACILWPDRDRQWEAIIPTLQSALPELFVLGDYAPEARKGPAIWLRCVIAGKIAEVTLPAGVPPILYLPGVSRQDLRAIESCQEFLKPLAELQYRGAIWSQVNAKDWTLLAFLKSDQGGLGLDVAQDNDAKNAMQLALHILIDEDVSILQGKRLDKDYFNTLLTGGDPTRDLLQWLNLGDAFKSARDETEWKAFVAVCKSQLAFNPETEGILAAAAKLATHEGPWQAAWERFCEAPHRYPEIPARIRKCSPPSDTMFWHVPDGNYSGWPQWNSTQEDNLRVELLGLSKAPAHEARNKILALEKSHGHRRKLVWAELGEAPLAAALEHLQAIAQYTQNSLAAGTVQDLVNGYRAFGWQVDDAVLKALASVESAAHIDVVSAAIRAMYLPWLEDSARYLQALFTDSAYPWNSTSKAQQPQFSEGDCVLFVDGLRFDLAKRLCSSLHGKGYTITEQPLWAAIPSVTATGKAAVTPVCELFTGQEGNHDFEPCVAASGQSLKGGYHLKRVLAEAGWTILSHAEAGTGKGFAWCEVSDIDTEGHNRGWKLAKHVDSLLAEVTERVNELAANGWKRIFVVTDHGWLLMPGGLPKIDLPAALTDNKWGRCASVKPGATTQERLFPWHWNAHQSFSLADGVSCFKNGEEYTHGGLSLQECLTLQLIVEPQSAGKSSAALIGDVSWKGMRCTVAIEGEAPGAMLDVRIQAGNSGSSVVIATKPIKEGGSASVVVEDDATEGKEAFVVLLDAEGSLIAQMPTVIGGGMA